jgi:hypothetical protein
MDREAEIERCQRVLSIVEEVLPSQSSREMRAALINYMAAEQIARAIAGRPE